MKKRSKRQLDRMHVWTHRRFHDAKGKYLRYWLAVRSKIQGLIILESRTVDLDEWLQIWAGVKVARDLGLSFTWEKTADGVIMGMGKSNDDANAVSIQRRIKRDGKASRRRRS